MVIKLKAQEYEIEALTEDLSWNLRRIQTICDNSSELLINEITVSGIKIALICSEGMVSVMTLSDMILNPISEIKLDKSTPQNLYEHIDGKMLFGIDRPKANNFGDLFRTLNSGFALILIDGVNKALAFGVQGFTTRSVAEPKTEGNLTGAHEGFVEVVRFNMSMIKRRIKSPYLKLELINKGSKSKTDLCLCYMRDRVSEKLLMQIKQSLDKMDLEIILSSGYVKPFVEEKTNNIFDSAGTTERPDVLCSKLMEGRVGILIDNVPYAVVVPKLFTESFQTVDDYDFKPYFSTFIRWVKYLAFFIAILLPAFYVASAMHHPELLNSSLLLILAEEERQAPFSLLSETIGVLIMYEIIREAGIRLPKSVGGAVSIVAGLIIGDAAVKSGFITTPLLTVVALAVISGFITPDLHQPITILRFLFVICGGLWGLFGISLIGAFTLFSICATEDYGYPVTAPLSPLTPKALRDVASRTNFKKMQKDVFTVQKLNTGD